MHLVGVGATLLKPGGWKLVGIQVLDQCSARHCHSHLKVNICVLPVLINWGVGAVSPPVLPVSERRFRHRNGVTGCCLWQDVWGENGHLCNSEIWLDVKGAAVPFDFSILMLSVSVCIHCCSHTVFLRNLEIGQGGKEWVKIQQGSYQLPFSGPRTVRRKLIVVLQSCLSFPSQMPSGWKDNFSRLGV